MVSNSLPWLAGGVASAGSIQLFASALGIEILVTCVMLNSRLRRFTFGPLFPEPGKAQADFGNRLVFPFSLCSTIAKTSKTVESHDLSPVGTTPRQFFSGQR